MTPSLEYLKPARVFTAPARCPHCGDLMVAPVSSEFVVGGEIRHHWDCEACGESTSTVFEVPEDAHGSRSTGCSSR